MFSRSGNPLLIFLQSYHVWVISKIQVNFRFKTYSEVLVNVSFRFLKFLDYPCFSGQRLNCWYSYRATMFGWPQKSRLTSGPTRIRRYWWLCLVDFLNFFTIYVFEVSKSFDDIPTDDFFHTQFIQIKHDPVCWLSRRLPIPYRISGIWSSYIYFASGQRLFILRLNFIQSTTYNVTTRFSVVYPMTPEKHIAYIDNSQSEDRRSSS